VVRADFLLTGASQIVTCSEIGQDALGVVTKGTLAAAGGEVVWVGDQSQLASAVELDEDATVVDALGKAVVPGFVDAHTHLVFAGQRREEFAERAAGRSYSAGGILDTVSATRAASTDELLSLARARADAMLRHGTTTAEAKTGYALDLEGELRLLSVLTTLNDSHPLDLEITFLPAHALPEEFEGRPDDFIDEVVGWMPSAKGLARWCDVFCDIGAFDADQSAKVLDAGKRAGLGVRIHANELASSGGAGLAARMGAASADHLLYLSGAEASSLAMAGTVGVVCPVTALGLGRFPDVPLMKANGMTVALASDFNPGTAYSENIQFAIAIATRAMGIGPSEALFAATKGAADSLRRSDIGRLVPGAKADMVVLAAEDFRDLGYHAGVNLAEVVIKGGSIYCL